MDDLISREQAIAALGERPTVWTNDDEYSLGARNQYDMDKLAIETVPSAQPTQLNTPNTLEALYCISRQDAVDIINGYAEQFNGYIGTPNDSEVYAYARGLLLSIERNISALTSAQPEIVRCKYCKFWREHKYAKYAKGTKRYIPFCGLNAIYTKSDDFCSKGERRTDEQT